MAMHLPIELIRHIATLSDPTTAGRLRCTCTGSAHIITATDMAGLEAKRLTSSRNGPWDTLAIAVDSQRVPNTVMLPLIPILLRMGADPHAFGCAMRGAIQCGSLHLVASLIHSQMIDVSVHGSVGVLHASQAGRADIVQLLLEAGAEVHDWALYGAAKMGHLHVVDVLLQAMRTKSGYDLSLNSAREAAMEGGHWEIAMKLDQAGTTIVAVVESPIIATLPVLAF
ncbi:hypothetical protein HK104_002719 [Borealophlyctis nickersoniae]|nr:hypothetical protein HK104_002719 [Borealophlyctis nickersoniae]